MQFLGAQQQQQQQPRVLHASIQVASFGTPQPYNGDAFALDVLLDPSAPPPSSSSGGVGGAAAAAGGQPLRYGKLPEIHHVFRAEPKSAPLLVTLVFTAAVLAAFPLLLGTVGQKVF